MKKITAYKLADGKIYESQSEALEAERKAGFEIAVNAFIAKQGLYTEEADTLRDIINENTKELYQLLSPLFKNNT